MKISVQHPANLVKIGFIYATQVRPTEPLELLETHLAETLAKRSHAELEPTEDALRMAARDMLRFQSYKPTGRAKPASEYLIRTAQEDNFPRINTLVDINNYISMKYILPISLWDVNKAGSEEFVFRPGFDGEEYVFNPTGQTISVTDLMTGFRVMDGREEPIVNPVKDSMLTKTDASTSRIGVAIYFPANSDESILNQALTEFAELLEANGGTVVEKGVY
jgi:DNA/RNA-binding domain of Phe-tRNA-synthetase-like protein